MYTKTNELRFWAVKKNKTYRWGKIKQRCVVKWDLTGQVALWHIKTLGNYTEETFDKTGVLAQTWGLNWTEQFQIKTNDCIFSLLAERHNYKKLN